jgi:hypothetical protein
MEAEHRGQAERVEVREKTLEMEFHGIPHKGHSWMNCNVHSRIVRHTRLR